MYSIGKGVSKMKRLEEKPATVRLTPRQRRSIERIADAHDVPRSVILRRALSIGLKKFELLPEAAPELVAGS